MLAPERREKILQEVRRNKSMIVKELCVMFNVTGETIRKDLAVLEQEGKLLKTHGGAYVQEGVHNELHAQIRRSICTEAKAAIGKACAAAVRSGETILLDESTTCLYIAKELSDFSRLTVLTNSLAIVNTLSESKGVDIIFFGGKFHRRNLSFTGEETIRMLSRFYADRAFVSCRGLDMRNGITDGGQEGGQVRRMMLEHASSSVLVADYTKFGHTNLYGIGGYDLINTVVADRMPEGWREFLTQKGIRAVETELEQGLNDK